MACNKWRGIVEEVAVRAPRPRRVTDDAVLAARVEALGALR